MSSFFGGTASIDTSTVLAKAKRAAQARKVQPEAPSIKKSSDTAKEKTTKRLADADLDDVEDLVSDSGSDQDAGGMVDLSHAASANRAERATKREVDHAQIRKTLKHALLPSSRSSLADTSAQRPRSDAVLAFIDGNPADLPEGAVGVTGRIRSKPGASTASLQRPPRLTPWEQQVAAVQAQWPGLVLMVETGYKFRFFGPGAVVAARRLGIWCYKPSDLSFVTASVPVFTAARHAARLVASGLRVGLVR